MSVSYKSLYIEKLNIRLSKIWGFGNEKGEAQVAFPRGRCPNLWVIGKKRGNYLIIWQNVTRGIGW